MKIKPYKSIDEICLEITEVNLLRHLGNPKNKKANNIGLMEYDFGSKVFRFDEHGALYEVTIGTETLELNNVSISFKQLATFIKYNDVAFFEYCGFIVSPEFGVAFDPEHSPWVTVLTKAGLAAWQNVYKTL